MKSSWHWTTYSVAFGVLVPVKPSLMVDSNIVVIAEDSNRAFTKYEEFHNIFPYMLKGDYCLYTRRRGGYFTDMWHVIKIGGCYK